MDKTLKEIFLKKDSGVVRFFYSQEEMKAAGFTKADKVVTSEEFNSNGCYTRIINGEIVVGRMEDEITADEKQERIAEIQSRFVEIDQLDGPRSLREAVRDLADTAGHDTTYLMRHEAEANELREELAKLQQSA